MQSIIHDGRSAVTSATFPHAPWCESDRHDDGATHPIPDSNWQVCFGPAFELDFEGRGESAAAVESVSGELCFEHIDVWGVRADPQAFISFNGIDRAALSPDQLLPVANLLRALDAMYKGDTERADAFMAEARAGVVEVEDDGREALREATRQRWAAEAAGGAE